MKTKPCNSSFYIKTDVENLLVTGATGHLGKAVIEELLNRLPAENISALVRNPAAAESLAAQGVRVLKADYDDPGSLRSAFRDIDKLYFVSGSDVAHRTRQHENVVQAAVDSRVGHIIYTSFQRKTSDGTSPIAFAASSHLLTEKLIKASGLTYTIMKHALYADILPMFIGDQVLHTGEIFLPAGNGKASFTSRSDMALAGAAVLAGKGHEDKIYEISADRSYSFYDIAELLSKHADKDIYYASPGAADFVRELDRVGVSEDAIQVVTTFCEAISQGEFNFPDRSLEKLIGRKPEKLEDFLKKAYGL